MRKRIFLEDRGGGGLTKLPDGSKATPLSVVLYNFKSKNLEIVEGDRWSVSSYPKFNNTSKPENSTSGFYPVGVVVIPGSHGVLKDGTGTVNQCGVMSLVPMNYNTPEKGGTSGQDFYWGGSGIDISGKSDWLGRYDSVSNGLTNYNEVNHVGNNGNVSSTIKGTSDRAYLPSDAFSTVPNPYDNKTGYYYNNGDYYIPSPYKNDGSYNPIYSQTTSPGSAANAMSDFKGIVNTRILTNSAISQDGWKTASTITNSMDSGYYPPLVVVLDSKHPELKHSLTVPRKN